MAAVERPTEGGGQLEPCILGAGALQCTTGGGHTFSPTGIPVATGGTHVIQIVDGGVSRAIATRTEPGMPPPQRPARRGEMRAWNHGDGFGADIVVRARRPVYTRTVDGQEQIVYRSSEMDEGKLYAVEWNGDHYALRKSSPNVEIFRFRPYGDGD